MADLVVISAGRGSLSFKDSFWGEGGLELLYQNMKHGLLADKELENYLMNRSKMEESFARELQKTAKSSDKVASSIGSFAAAWQELVVNVAEKMAVPHMTIANKLTDLAKDVATYHTAHKDNYKQVKEQVVTPAFEAVQALEAATSAVHKAKAAYQTAVQARNDSCEKFAKAQREQHPAKELERYEGKMKKAEAAHLQSEADYKLAVQKHETANQDFKDKMVVACERMQKLETEHLEQMKKFVSQLLDMECEVHNRLDLIKKHQAKEVGLKTTTILQQWVTIKANGTEPPVPLKFEPIENIAVAGMLQSTKDNDGALPRSSSMSHLPPGGKKLFGRKKKEKKKSKGSGEPGTNAVGEGPEGADDAEVDEDGYRIRPKEANRVGDGQGSDFSYSSGSDDEGETTAKLKNITIRPVDGDRLRTTSSAAELNMAAHGLSLRPRSDSKPRGAVHAVVSETSKSTSLLDDDLPPVSVSLPPPMAGSPLTPMRSEREGTPSGPSPALSRASGSPMLLLAGPPGSKGSPRQSRSTVASPLNGEVSGLSSPQSSSTPVPTNVQAVPLAVQFVETVNAMLTGESTSTLIKVTGDVQLSFPATAASQLAPTSAPVSFRLGEMSRLTQHWPNQQFLERDSAQSSNGSAVYHFKMANLHTFLQKQHEQSPNAPFYNIDIIKYQVNASSASLPVHFSCHWKCEPSATELMVKYTYNNSWSSHKTPLQSVTFIAPVDGGVTNHLSRPLQLLWANERATWKLPEPLTAADNSGERMLHARFDVSRGPSQPSPVALQFLCEGQVMSGVSFELSCPAYRLSLFKRKVISGKYLAQPK